MAEKTGTRWSLSLALLFLFLFPGPSLAQSWDATLPGVLDGVAASYWQPSVQAAFGTFTFAYTELPSGFSRWLEESLAGAIAKSTRLRLFNRQAAAAMDPAFKAMYGDFFEKNGVDALLYGRYFDEGEVVRARIELTGLSDGVLIGTTEVRIPKTALPRGLEIQPPVSVSQTAQSLTQLLPAAGGGAGQKPLRVSVSTERGPGAVYREGEDLVVLLTLDEDAWIKVYHVDVKGAVQLIWPNRFGGGKGLVQAGAEIRIPGPGDPFSFQMTPPFGTEFIKVVASTVPFAATEADFSELGGSGGATRSVITRGLALVGTASPGAAAVQQGGAVAQQAPAAAPQPARMAEDLASYVIMDHL